MSLTITQSQGIPPEQFRALAAELGVTQAALTSFFNILQQQHVPREDLDAKLREIATHYQTLLARVRTLSADDPQIIQLREAAETAINAGDFHRAEHLLNEASARDLAAAQELQGIITKRFLSAAEAQAANGLLKMTQLAYVDAGAYYRQAAAIVPRDAGLAQAEYLNAEGLAWYDAGQYADAQPPLEHALALREKTLSPRHPDVATSLNNLALLYQAQGRYEAAEPLYQRALALRKAVLGAEHPHVAVVLESYAVHLQAINRDEEARALAARAQAIRANHI